MPEKQITQQDVQVAHQYATVMPKQFGNMHERMKYLMQLLRTESALASVPSEIWHAIFDLETEVKYHKPTNPPFGRRCIPKKYQNDKRIISNPFFKV